VKRKIWKPENWWFAAEKGGAAVERGLRKFLQSLDKRKTKREEFSLRLTSFYM
jgi:hypothetical protein